MVGVRQAGSTSRRPAGYRLFAMRHLLALAVALATVCSVAGQAPASGQPIDWDKLRPEILDRYRELVQIDSTSGRETLGVN